MRTIIYAVVLVRCCLLNRRGRVEGGGKRRREGEGEIDVSKEEGKGREKGGIDLERRIRESQKLNA